ncbi:MAG: alpha/beta fold hydrolase [Deltaproteobacteria bacterium]|nr:alpha/beta fold hydrolase [Deltaproteobacteria bacterium]MBI3386175.1 alpha/beta fold hydrolase [Deltaproteobacteria bacterium]
MADAELLRADAFPIEQASVRGFTMRFVRAGIGGFPLLLIHGWPETKRIWYRNIAPLVAAGFEVIAPDLRGFGDSDIPADGFFDLAAHARDLYALVHDGLGHQQIVVVGGDLGGAILQDLGMRFPGFVVRQVVFNSPLPYLREEHRGLRTRPAMEAADYYLRQGTGADSLLAELSTELLRRDYIAAFYGHRFWASPGTFTSAAVTFLSEPFADPAKLRAGWGNYESAMGTRPQSEPPLWGKNTIPTLILFGPDDHVIYPDFDEMAARVFPEHIGPFRLSRCGHFLQWEQAHVLNQTVRYFCADLLARRR